MLSNAFSASIEIIIYYIPFILFSLFLRGLILIGVKQPCVPGLTLTLARPYFHIAATVLRGCMCLDEERWSVSSFPAVVWWQSDAGRTG